MLIDSHSHLYLEAFADDLSEVIERAKQVGVQEVFLPAIDSGHHEELLSLVHAYPKFFRPMMGVHPCSIQPETWEAELEAARALLEGGSFCAVGEIGIDLYWDKSTLDIQRLAFRRQIGWAKEMGLPIVIHCREAFDEIFEEVESLNSPDLRGVFHCFTGTREQAERIMGFGDFMMGIGGVLTFKNSGLDAVVADIPLEYLVLETDAPYLTPTPFRGKRNESAFLEHIWKKLAAVKGCSEAEVARATTTNALKMFNR